MRYRAAQTLVYSRAADGSLLGCNFLAKSVFACDTDLIAFLGALPDWAGFEEIADATGMPADEARGAIEGLVAVAAILEEGSPLARAEDEFRAGWNWGLPSAMMHFCVQDPDHMSLAESEVLQRQKAESGQPQPPLYSRNNSYNTVRPLPEARDGNKLIDLMARRRTVRAAAQPTITLKQLSDCLFAGMGITGETENCVGKLPLGMTPSGGARNPYEAYVYAVNVEGLAPGFYHYSARDHDLGLVETNHMPKPSELVGGQDWADEMPCVILLCASFGRTMWKYDDANAYRVVLIEAGHIGQNIMLAATEHGLTACPTAALSHTTIRECIGMHKLTDAPVYALTLCVPGIEKGRELLAAG